MAEDKKNLKNNNPSEPRAPDSGNGTPDNSPATVDIDSLVIKILMIVSVPNQFHSVSTFLSRRGWPTTVTGSINEAIRFLTTDKPEFVMVSVNHPSPRLAMLPNLLTQTFNTNCVAFAEKTDHKSIGKLNSLKAHYKMMGPVSGPSIQRKLKMILAEMYGLNSGTESASSNHADDTQDDQGDIAISQKGSDLSHDKDVIRFSNDGPQSGFVQVKGQNQPGGKPGSGHPQGSEINEEAYRQLREALAEELEDNPEFMSNFESPEEAVSSVWQKADSSRKSAKSDVQGKKDMDEADAKAGERSEISDKDPRVQGTDSESEKSPLIMNQSEREKQGLTGFTREKDLKSSASGSNPESEADGSLLSQGERDRSSPHFAQGQKANDGIDLQGGEKADASSTMASGNPMERGRQTSGGGQDQTQDDVSGAGDSENADRVPDLEDHEKNELGESQDFIFAAIKRSLDEVSDPPAQKLQHMTQVQWLGVVPVKAIGFVGYLLLATSLGTDSLKRLTKSFKGRLNRELQEAPADFEFSPELMASIQTVDFQDWARYNLPMMYVRECGAGEIGVAFLPTENLLPEPAPASDQSKLILPLDAVDETIPLTFKAFLFLSVNKKYFMYLREGSRLSAKRRDKLKERKTELFLDKKELDKFLTYYVSARIQKAVGGFLEHLKLTKKKAG